MDSYFWLVGVVLAVSVALVAIGRLALVIQKKRQAQRFKELERHSDD